MLGLRRLAKEYGDLRRFQQGAQRRRIVFYAENHGAWPHLGPIVEHLTTTMGRDVAYVTADVLDPVLSWRRPRLETYGVGSGPVGIFFFETLRNAVLVTTTPDLNRFHVKRSRFGDVRYCYVHHSMVSSHMAYRPGAFDHFDAIFCVGPHHVVETRVRERLFGLGTKDLVEHGYGHLDSILARGAPVAPSPDTVLVIPSWGPHGLLETSGEHVIEALVAEGFRVIVRPHPRTLLLSPDVLTHMRHQFAGDARVAFDLEVDSGPSMRRATVAISDWSGAALEFAFGYERPVVFVDGPRKVNDPEYGQLEIEPIEVSLREELGSVIGAADWSGLRAAVRAMIGARATHGARARVLRAGTVFNVGESAAAAAIAIVREVSA
jgi:hypothetical protein